MGEVPTSAWRVRFANWQIPAWGFPLILFFVCAASYGVLISALGFYWDDFPISWIGETYGTAGLERYFSTNRPFWGWLYRLTMPLLGSENPLPWQIFNIFWRWLSVVALWKLLRLIWKGQETLAAGAALLFAVFPAFRQMPIALLYSHFFIVLTIFLFSQILTLTAVRRFQGSTRSLAYWLITWIALAFSLYNLLAMEYFFVLELIRGAFIWCGLKDLIPSLKRRAARSLWIWLPYLMILAGVIIWRVFIFSYQTQNYSMLFLDRFQEEPVAAVFYLLRSILLSLWAAGPGAWLDVLNISTLLASGKLVILIYALLVIFSGLMLVLALNRFALLQLPQSQKTTSLSMVAVGAGACLLAGWPFWLIEVLPTANFPLDRFTLPFALGMSLLGAGLVGLLPFSARWQSILLALFVSLAVGYQFQVSNDYRREWEVTQRFFWQLTWRVPGIKPGTLVLSNDLPLWRHSDNSLTAPLNRFYAPENTSQSMSFLLYYPEQRLGKSLQNLEPRTPVSVDYLAATFEGNTSQAVALVYTPPGCLRILDPELDYDNEFLPQLVQDAARLSDTSLILVTGAPALPSSVMGIEPEHGWCYYFEKADLARQQEDWQTVVDLGEQAFKLGDYPNDPSERIPFIEAYAHVGRWQQAIQQTRLAVEVSSAMQPIMCRLWQRIEQETVASTDQTNALKKIRTELNCAR